MLVYNVYEMSNTSTPTRPGRGMPVPGIDTHGAAEHQAAPLSFSGWPLTPPQSAVDSRRPSLAFSSFSDASTSGPSSVAEYSQPSTPVETMAHQSFTRHWSEGPEVQANMPNNFNEGCIMGQMQPIFQTAFHQQAMCSGPTAEAPVYAQSGHQAHIGFAPQQSPLRQEAWNHSQNPAMGINVHAPGLKTTLFQSATGLSHEMPSATASMYAQPSTSMPSPAQSAFQNYDEAKPMVPSSMFQAPHTVVPSQLSPQEDYNMDGMSQDFGSGFDSAGAGYNHGWESVGPPSPNDDYFAHAKNEDYIMVKGEVPGTPSRASPYHAHAHRYIPTSSPDSRIKRRTSKRSRKGHSANKTWLEFESPHCQVRYEGKPFTVVGNKIIPHSIKERKPHQCQVTKDNGELCGASFERSEHLKRHMGSHTGVRNYPCPLDTCDKAIGRPDNAGDHFKTHLRPPTKGKRNKFCTWEMLESRILEAYPEKQSTKLLTNLRKWMALEREKGTFDNMDEQLRARAEKGYASKL